MLDLDLLLTAVGIVLAAIGVGVLLLGRSRVSADGERRNVFEAFGIKIDVANPSVLLIMFGVVLMLTPRFLPIGKGPQEAAKPATPAVTVQAPVAPRPSTPAPSASSIPAPAPPAAASTPAPTGDGQAVAQQAARAAAAARARELAELQAQREAAAREQAALAEQRARLAESERRRAASPVPVVAPPRLVILTEAFNYEGETDGSLRAKLHGELRTVAADVLGKAVQLDSQNPGFRKTLRLEDMAALCKRTQADHLLLADLTPVAVESFSVESANWPNMRYSAVACDSHRVGRSSELRMEPTVGDKYPLQQSVADSARNFVRDHRHLLQ